MSSTSVSAMEKDKQTDTIQSGALDVVDAKFEPEASQSSPGGGDGEHPKGFRLAMVVLALVLSVFLVALDLTIIATAIPRITDQFHSLDQIGWYGSAFFLTLASFQATWGKAYKFFNLKGVFVCAIGIFELGSLICGVARNSSMLIAGRAIAGLGAAGIASGTYTIIAFAAPPRLRPAFTGILGATYGCASVVGPLLGGVFTDKATWRWCFYINLPIGITSAAVILLLFKAPTAAKPTKATIKEKFLQMDFIGTFTIMASTTCFLLAAEWGGITKAWSSPDIIALIVLFGILLLTFIVNEWWQGDRAQLIFKLLKDRTLLVVCLFTVLFSGSFFVLLYYIPIYFQAIDGVSAQASGIRNLPLIVAVSIGTVLSGGLISALGHYVPFVLAGGILTTIGTGLIYTLQVASKSSHWIGYQVIAGFGIGLAFQIPMIVAQSICELSEVSHVTAITLFFQMMGGTFFISTAQSIFANKLLYHLGVNVPALDPNAVVGIGATQFRASFPSTATSGIILSYMQSLHSVFAFAIALAGLSAILGLFSKWRTIHVRL